MNSHLLHRVTVKEAIEVLAHHFELHEGMIWGFLFTGAAAELNARGQLTARHSTAVLSRPDIQTSSNPDPESTPVVDRAFDFTGKLKPTLGAILLKLTTEAGENAAGAEPAKATEEGSAQ